MAIFTKTIPTEIVDEVIAAYCNAYNYQTEIEDENGDLIPNPETDIQFAKRIDIEFTKNILKAYRVKVFNEGKDAVLTIADTDAETLTIE